MSTALTHQTLKTPKKDAKSRGRAIGTLNRENRRLPPKKAKKVQMMKCRTARRKRHRRSEHPESS